MITKLVIENLRGIGKGELDQLSPVSVLVGPNNSGKSTCLEAIELAGAGFDRGAINACVKRRGTPEAWQRNFAKDPGSRTIAAVTDEQGIQATLFNLQGDKDLPFDIQLLRESIASEVGSFVLGRTKVRSHYGFVVRMVDVGAIQRPRALEDAYTAIDRAGQLEAAIDALKASMPALEDLRILKVENDFILHTFTREGERVPTYLAGDGFKRLLELAAALASLPNGVALLEEPESYQHPRYLRELVGLIRHAVEKRTQVIISTHSLELIDALLHADWPAEAMYPTIHRLRLIDGNLKATALTRAQAITSRDELVEDLRA